MYDEVRKSLAAAPGANIIHPCTLPSHPEPMADYWKYHGLGNDYLVIPAERFVTPPEGEAIRKICDRHRGIGADGVLIGPLPRPDGIPGLRIINPDGKEGEKSGNGLRIFARYLWEQKRVTEKTFPIHTAGGQVTAQVMDEDGALIRMEMGQVSFSSERIPVKGPSREVLRETIEMEGKSLTINCATIGNPHCVVLADKPTEELARRLGPSLEIHPWFPNRSNVQFMAVESPHTIRIEIWERGAGYTLSSGTSSCASAAVAVRLGLCQSPVTVKTAGGNLLVTLDNAFQARLEGPVAFVGNGAFSPEFLEELGLTRQ